MTREGLVAAKTSQDHLQNRVDELQIMLKASEEKLAAMQPVKSAELEGPPTQESDDIGDSTSREQELKIEIADLTRDLTFTRADLESTKTNVEQYKQIAQNSEDALQSLTESHDAFREDTEQQIQERDVSLTCRLSRATSKSY